MINKDNVSWVMTRFGFFDLFVIKINKTFLISFTKYRSVRFIRATTNLNDGIKIIFSEKVCESCNEWKRRNLLDYNEAKYVTKIKKKLPNSENYILQKWDF